MGGRLEVAERRTAGVRCLCRCQAPPLRSAGVESSLLPAGAAASRAARPQPVLAPRLKGTACGGARMKEGTLRQTGRYSAAGQTVAACARAAAPRVSLNPSPFPSGRRQHRRKPAAAGKWSAGHPGHGEGWHAHRIFISITAFPITGFVAGDRSCHCPEQSCWRL